jgi:hypothetical protein
MTTMTFHEQLGENVFFSANLRWQDLDFGNTSKDTCLFPLRVFYLSFLWCDYILTTKSQSRLGLLFNGIMLQIQQVCIGTVKAQTHI